MGVDYVSEAYNQARLDTGDYGFCLDEFRRHVNDALARSKFCHPEKLQLGDLYLTLGLIQKNETAWKYFDRHCNVVLLRGAMKVLRNMPDAENAVSRCIESFLVRGFKYNGSGPFASWLYRFAIGRAIDYLRAKPDTEELSPNLPDPTPTGSPYEECEGLVSKLWRNARTSLSSAEAEMVDYHFRQGMKKNEIAVVIARAPSNVTRGIKGACKTLESAISTLCREWGIRVTDVIECIRLVGLSSFSGSR